MSSVSDIKLIRTDFFFFFILKCLFHKPSFILFNNTNKSSVYITLNKSRYQWNNSHFRFTNVYFRSTIRCHFRCTIHEKRSFQITEKNVSLSCCCIHERENLIVNLCPVTSHMESWHHKEQNFLSGSREKSTSNRVAMSWQIYLIMARWSSVPLWKVALLRKCQRA